MPAPSSTAILNIGEFAKPVDTLLQMISGAIGEIWLPYQVKRLARADVEVSRIKQEGGLLSLHAVAEQQVQAETAPPEERLILTPAEQRGLVRMVKEQGRFQENIERIVAAALPRVTEDARPEQIEPEWMTRFFDRCKHTVSEDMQSLWSKVLAQEANKPGSLSRHTLGVLAGMERADAERFAALCRFTWFIVNDLFPVYLGPSSTYNSVGIYESNTQELTDVGLIERIDIGLGFPISPERSTHQASYFDHQYLLDCTKLNGRTLSIGHARFTRAGKELMPISHPQPIPGFEEMLLQRWRNDGVVITLVEEVNEQVATEPSVQN